MEKGRTVQTGSLKISEDVILTTPPGGNGYCRGPQPCTGPLQPEGFHCSLRYGELYQNHPNVDIAQINICVNLIYGYKIKDVAQQIQENVKATVQNMTGITVSKVNVFIAGVEKKKQFKELSI